MSFIYSKHGHNCREVVTIAGSFQPAGASSAPTKVSGLGYTVALVDDTVGQYVITLNDNALTNFVSAQCSLGLAAPDGSHVTFVAPAGVIFDRTNRQVKIQALDVAGDAVELDQTEDAESIVCFVLHFSKSSLPVV